MHEFFKFSLEYNYYVDVFAVLSSTILFALDLGKRTDLESKTALTEPVRHFCMKGCCKVHFNLSVSQW